MGRAREHSHMMSTRGKLLRQAANDDGVAGELRCVSDAEDQYAQGYLKVRAVKPRLRLRSPFRGNAVISMARGARGESLQELINLVRSPLPGEPGGALYCTAREFLSARRVR